MPRVTPCTCYDLVLASHAYHCIHHCSQASGPGDLQLMGYGEGKNVSYKHTEVVIIDNTHQYYSFSLNFEIICINSTSP